MRGSDVADGTHPAQAPRVQYPSFQPASHRPANLPAIAAPLPSPRVLVIEGEAVLSESLAQILSNSFAVTSVATSTEALALLEAGEAYDVLVCVRAKSQVDGVDLLERVAAIAPELVSRFLFVTSGPDTSAREPGATAAERPIDIRALRGVAEWHFSH
jgi:CheY-like chemotaxis protein